MSLNSYIIMLFLLANSSFIIKMEKIINYICKLKQSAAPLRFMFSTFLTNNYV